MRVDVPTLTFVLIMTVTMALACWGVYIGHVRWKNH